MNPFKWLVEAFASMFYPLYQRKRSSAHVPTLQPSVTSQAQPVSDFSSIAKRFGEPEPWSNVEIVESSAETPARPTRTQSLPQIKVCTTQGLDPSPGGSPSSVSSNGLSPSLSPSSRRNSEITLVLGHDGTILHAKRSRSNSRSSTFRIAEELKEKLRYSRVESVGFRFFVPKQDLEALITEPTVTSILQYQGLDTQTAASIASQTSACAKSLFATLVYLEKGGEIQSLLEEGITDVDLPFMRPTHDRSFPLQTKDGSPIKTLERWIPGEREEFYRTQWWMTAPVFEDLEHYNLDDNDVLPFVPLTSEEEEKYRRNRGGYSQVYPARIHPAHHNLRMPVDREGGPLVAIKKLSSSDEKQFNQEASILRNVGRKEDLHLIKLLTTFRQGEHYHLVFPFADSNLRAYWDDRKLPAFDRETVLWSFRQIAGIASGLSRIHNFQVTIPLSVSGKVRVQQDAKLQVQEKEELYGRHGDIKPENILWFRQMTGVDDANGILQIADFGLGRFHGRDSRSGIDPKGIAGWSPTYEPPECKINRPVSRAYDIWSLGCLYLEFVTWLLKGSQAIYQFSAARAKDNPTGFNDDNFFEILGSDAKVGEGVVTWVNELHCHPRCSQVIHDSLDLIMEHMIVIDSEDRIASTLLSRKLKSLLERATMDGEYLLKPVPRSLNGPLSDVLPHSTSRVRFADETAMQED
ncbi:hypothetical protein VTN77DRAFT_4356 [Rasamsonia byssochlamydoides]|uniref:uncharacterized protein n=1 Tax=Rasamsonia byssochlamydoides TaxID=89139 RepID=UPI00374278F2